MIVLAIHARSCAARMVFIKYMA